MSIFSVSPEVPQCGQCACQFQPLEMIATLADRTYKVISVAAATLNGVADLVVKATLHFFSRECWFTEPAVNGSIGPTNRDPKKKPVIFINGVLNSIEHLMDSAKLVSKAMGDAVVNYTLNATNGLISDALQVLMQSSHRDDPPTKLLVQNIRDRLAETDGDVVLLAHSEGGFIVSQIRDELEARERERIKVYTFGSADLIEDGVYKKVVNFVSRSDGIPFVMNPVKSLKAMMGYQNNVRFMGTTCAVPFLSHLFSEKDYQDALKIVAEEEGYLSEPEEEEPEGVSPESEATEDVESESKKDAVEVELPVAGVAVGIAAEIGKVIEDEFSCKEREDDAGKSVDSPTSTDPHSLTGALRREQPASSSGEQCA